MRAAHNGLHLMRWTWSKGGTGRRIYSYDREPTGSCNLTVRS